MSDAKNKKTVYLHDDEVQIINSEAGRTPSRYVRTAVKHLYDRKVLVFKITNKVNKRVMVGIDKIHEYYTLPILQRLKYGKTLVSADIEEYGASAFRVENLGSFATILEASEYHDFLLNKLYDAGKVLYNEELYNGTAAKTLTIKVEYKFYRKLLDVCAYKKITIRTLVVGVLRELIRKRKG